MVVITGTKKEYDTLREEGFKASKTEVRRDEYVVKTMKTDTNEADIYMLEGFVVFMIMIGTEKCKLITLDYPLTQAQVAEWFKEDI